MLSPKTTVAIILGVDAALLILGLIYLLRKSALTVQLGLELR